jgi:hypothetical protein
LNSGRSLVCVGHFNKSETAGLTGVAIPYDTHAFDGAKGGESALQFSFCGLVRKVSYENIGHGFSCYCPHGAVDDTVGELI